MGEAVDRPAPQRRRPGPGEPRAPEEVRVDAPHADVARGSQVVPLHGRPHRHVRRDPDRRLPHGLHGRARVRGLVPPFGRAGRVGRDLVGRRVARSDAARARSARHPAYRVGPDLRGVRVRRPGRSVRGGDRIRSRPEDGRRLRGPRLRSRSATRTRSACWSGSSSRATRPPATATRSTSAVSASGSSRAGRAARSSRRTSRWRGWRRSTRTLDTKLEVGKLDGLQKRIAATVVRFPFYDPDKTRPRS